MPNLNLPSTQVIADKRSFQSKINGSLGGRPQIDFDMHAKNFLKMNFMDQDQTVLLRYYRKSWYHFNGVIYERLRDDNLDARLIKFISGNIGTKAINIKDLKCALKSSALSGFDTDLEAPFKIGEKTELNDYLSMENGDLISPVRLIQHDEEAIIKASPNIFSLKKLNFNYSPSAICPSFEKYLNDVHSHKEEIVELDKFGGYCLTKKMIFNKMLVCVGGAGTGKSTFAEILSKVLGDYAKSFSIPDLTSDKEKIHLTNCNLLVIEEGEDRLPEGALKASTDKGSIKYRELYKESHEAPKTAKIILVANEIKLSDKSGALLRDRMLVSCFENKIRGTSKQNMNFSEDVVSGEAAGIFNRWLKGLEMLLNEGFKETSQAKEFKDDYESESNTSKAFIIENLAQNDNSFLSNKILKVIYENYKAKLKGDKFPDSLNDFKRAILSVFPQAKRHKNKAGRGIKGVNYSHDIHGVDTVDTTF